MTPKRTIVVAIAVVVGVAASVLSYVFLNNAAAAGLPQCEAG